MDATYPRSGVVARLIPERSEPASRRRAHWWNRPMLATMPRSPFATSNAGYCRLAVSQAGERIDRAIGSLNGLARRSGVDMLAGEGSRNG